MKKFDLRKFRKDHHLTQGQLADLLGCRQNFISQIESGKGKNNRDFPIAKFYALQDEYGDLSAYISNEPDDNYQGSETKNEQEISEPVSYISGNNADNIGYISLPSRFLDELTKLTDTISSQQRTIEKLVNKKIIN